MARLLSLDPSGKVVTALICLGAGGAFGWILLLRMRLELSIWAGVSIFMALAFWVVAQNINAHQSPIKFRIFWSALPLLALFPYLYVINTFGTFSWDSVLLHLNGGMGVAPIGVTLFVEAIPFILGMIATIFVFALIKGKGILRQRLDLAFAIFLVCINYAIVDPIRALAYPEEFSLFANENYVEPLTRGTVEAGTEGDQPKNFLHIFLESTERTFGEVPEIAEIMQPLQPWSDRGMQATNLVESVLLASSVSGMTAANCGVPAYFLGLVSTEHSNVNGDLFPGINCLGDVMKARGYNLAHVTGWPINFLQHASLYSAHGFDKIYGPDDAEAILTGTRYGNTNIISDDSVLAASLVALRDLRSSNRPYGLTIATSGGHRPNGFMAPACEGRDDISDDLADVFRATQCTNLLVAEFLEQAEAEGLLKDTVLIIQSDHLLPPSPGVGVLNGQDRTNFFSISGPGISAGTFDQEATMLDVFPTILDALDVPSESQRAGLGVSLFSENPTLIEQNGLSLFDTLLRQDRHLKHRMWAPRNTNGPAEPTTG
ncbi:MAG: sulfatase-like hydrolase/transferase [Pseudomonadota bacterium]